MGRTATDTTSTVARRSDAAPARHDRSEPSDGGRRPPGASTRAPDVSRILGLSVPVAVMLADRYMPIEAIVGITVGTIIEFDVPFDSELVLEVAGRPIGKGAAIKIGENFGLRVSEIGPVGERIDAMGGQ